MNACSALSRQRLPPSIMTKITLQIAWPYKRGANVWDYSIHRDILKFKNTHLLGSKLSL